MAKHWSILYLTNSTLLHCDLVVEYYTVHEMPFTSTTNLLQMDLIPKCQMFKTCRKYLKVGLSDFGNLPMLWEVFLRPRCIDQQQSSVRNMHGRAVKDVWPWKRVVSYPQNPGLFIEGWKLWLSDHLLLNFTETYSQSVIGLSLD